MNYLLHMAVSLVAAAVALATGIGLAEWLLWANHFDGAGK